MRPAINHTQDAGPQFRQHGSIEIRCLDRHLLVVEKPSGLLSVPAKPPRSPDCVETRLRAEFPEVLLVHRLDFETSGVMVFARTRLAQRHLNWQFQRREVSKTYVARVLGGVKDVEGRIDLPLTCDWPNRPLQKVCYRDGRPALTDWRVEGCANDVSRLVLHPLTGRSHQIRVHLAAIGHPILGDPFYGSPEATASADRLQLHAAGIAFRHPDGGARVSFLSQPPF